MPVRERSDQIAATARAGWARYHRILLWLSVILMSAIVPLRLGGAFSTLIVGLITGDTTKLFHLLIQRWFASIPVYSIRFAVHLPATYVILWPFFGWPEIAAARWIWVAATAVAIVWLVYLIVRESGANTAPERAFVALLPLSMYAMALTVRFGQLGVHILPVLLAGLLLLHHRRPGWGRDLLSATLLLLALVKPTVAALFVWIALVLPGGLRPTVLIALGYAALTLFAVSYQADGLPKLFHDWLARSSELAETAGTANLHLWLTAIGLGSWILPTSLIVFGGLGWWIYRHRHVDLWLLLAVTAIVARFWTYHRAYDDLLLLLPAIALFRLAKRGASNDGADVAAAGLLALNVIGMLIPARLLRPLGRWHLLSTSGNAVLWIILLVFLIRQAAREKHSRGSL